ncbi:MAG: signal peptidase I [Clostridia bacterium]|nr:signal peptidase I [Clostridia bacterium]
MKIFKKITSALATIIFIICLVLLALVMVTPKDAAGNKRVNIAGYSIMTVMTGSMEPAYQVGDIIVIKKTNENELQVKDVITFISTDEELNGQPITHRIIDITEENGQKKFETKGDNNRIADETPVTSDRILGKVQLRIPFVGRAVNFMQTNRIAFFLIVILPMLVIMALEVKDIIMIARSGDEDEGEEDNK